MDPFTLGGSFLYRYGVSTSYGSNASSAPLLAGVGSQPATFTLAGLAPSTTYHAQLVLTTPDGSATSTDVTFATLAAPPTPKVLPIITPLPPTISSASLTNKRFRVGSKSTAISAKTHKPVKTPQGTSFRFTLSGSAKVQIAITHSASGLRSGHSCLAPSTSLKRKHAKRCTRTVTVGTLTRSNEAAGVDSVAFSGRIGSKKLGSGAYKAVIGASNGGGSAKPVTLAFTVVR